ncbi:MAG: dTMP kinase [Actinobacteria bacterium]|nr:dTMP kinase [Actinomycetota bacterium]MBI3686357.1 dTMP kinase [Actinomycetota bacterium]
MDADVPAGDGSPPYAGSDAPGAGFGPLPTRSEADLGADPDLVPTGGIGSTVRGVLRTSDFRRLWAVLSLSSVGDWLGLLATTALAAELANSYAGANYALGGVLLVRLIPSALLGPIAGAFADKFDRRYTMAVSDVARCLLFVSIPLVQSLLWLYIATFLIECVTLFWTPAKEAAVPNLVRKDQLEAANQLSLATTYGLAPVTAALLFAGLAALSRGLAGQFSFFRTNQVDLALYLNAVTFAVSAATVFTVTRISSAQRGDGVEQPGIFQLLHEGAGFVKKTPLVRGLVIGILGAFAAAGAVIGTGRTYAASLGGGDASYGLLFGGVFVGLGLGIVLGPRVVRDLSRRRLFGLSIVLAGTCLALVAVMPHLVLALLAVVGVGFGGGLAYLSGTVLLGAEVHDSVRGRTFALITSMVRVVLILTLASVPFLVGLVSQRRLDLFGVRFVIDGSRIMLIVAGVLAVAVGLVSYRQMDDRQALPVLADLMAALRGDTTARRRLQRGGVFVAFEGGEGAGKTTQVDLLAGWLRSQAVTVTVTHEPGATAAGRQMRTILLDGQADRLTPRSEALLFAADRAHHVDTVIRPALDAGEVVLCDRYVDSSLAYQGGGRSLPVEEVRRLSRWATDGLVPDLTVVLDIDVAEGLTRAGGRSPADRLERESVEFHERVRRAFLALADERPDRYLVLDAARPADQVAEVIRDAVVTVLVQRGGRWRRTFQFASRWVSGGSGTVPR